MLKHVQISPLRNRLDSVSLRSSTSCASSICGSPEPPNDMQRAPSRASSYSSLSEQLPQTTIKIFTNCLKIDIEYKTLGIQWDTTSKELILQLLRRLKMRHRDPRLFFLSMEVSVRRAGVKTILVLDDDTRPAILQACHPKGESRFCLQLKPGGLIRVHTSALQPTSQYKSLVISEETTSDELLQLLLSCYKSMEPVEHFSIYEVCPGQEYQRKLHPDDIPLRAQAERLKRGETSHFLVRRNPNYTRRRQLLATLNESYQPSVTSKAYSDAKRSLSSLDENASLLDISIDSISDDLRSLMTNSDEDEEEDCASSASSISGSSDTSSSGSSSEGSTTVLHHSSNLSLVPSHKQGAIDAHTVCMKCRNSFKSCEFCSKNSSMIHQQLQRHPNKSTTANKALLASYNPVYNIREIRTASHSFSSLGSDKKLLDIQLSGRFDADTSMTFRLRPQSLFMATSSSHTCPPRMILNHSESNPKITDLNGNQLNTVATTGFADEVVNNNPARGLGHFVYL